jgi:hypothetical protein
MDTIAEISEIFQTGQSERKYVDIDPKSFLLLSNWFLFLSSFAFALLFRHCFILVSLAHVVSSLAYPNLLGTKRLGCCC